MNSAITLGTIAGELAETSKAAAEQEAAEGGLMGSLKARLSSVVKIRKLDEADWPSVLDAAKALIGEGELGKAVELISSQPGHNAGGDYGMAGQGRYSYQGRQGA